MNHLEARGWKEGLRKIDLDKFVREATGASLKEAKEKVDDLLNGEAIELAYLPSLDFETVARKLKKLGVLEVTRK